VCHVATRRGAEVDTMRMVMRCPRSRRGAAAQPADRLSGILVVLHKRDYHQVVPDAAPKHEQPGVLTRVEWIWGADPGTKAESIWLIMVSRTVPIQRAQN
jgi:hypothetical protein